MAAIAVVAVVGIEVVGTGVVDNIAVGMAG